MERQREEPETDFSGSESDSEGSWSGSSASERSSDSESSTTSRTGSSYTTTEPTSYTTTGPTSYTTTGPTSYTTTAASEPMHSTDAVISTTGSGSEPTTLHSLDESQEESPICRNYSDIQSSLRLPEEYKFHRRVYFVRTAERTDRIFPNWTRNCFFGPDYIPTDLNQCVKLPLRRRGDFTRDTPITEMGQLNAQLLGRGFRIKQWRSVAVVSSPALRCLQTAAGILRQWKQEKEDDVEELKVKIEPGLFECLQWYGEAGFPHFLDSKELQDSQIPVDFAYKPVMSIQELQAAAGGETEPTQTYKRLSHVLGSLLKKYPGNVLVVGHAVTLDAGVRTLLKKTADHVVATDLIKLGMRYPYCCTLAFHQHGAIWKPLPEPIPPISSLDFDNRLDTSVLVH